MTTHTQQGVSWKPNLLWRAQQVSCSGKIAPACCCYCCWDSCCDLRLSHITTLPAEITVAFLDRVLPFWFLEQSSPQSWEFLVRADELVLAICVLIYLRSSFITCHLDPGSFCRLLFWYLCLAHWLPVVAGILVPQFWGPTCNQTAFQSSVFQFPFHQQPCLGLCIRTHEGHGGRCCLDKCLSILPSAITRTALQGNEKRDLG